MRSRKARRDFSKPGAQQAREPVHPVPAFFPANADACLGSWLLRRMTGKVEEKEGPRRQKGSKADPRGARHLGLIT